jgi:hypothetical protein
VDFGAPGGDEGADIGCLPPAAAPRSSRKAKGKRT